MSTNSAADLFFGPLKRRAKYTVKDNGGNYSFEYYREHFRHEIAEDCNCRCVYCDCHENEVGGRESMELDHFRPWSRPEFTELKNEPANFHHACGRCNRLKGDRWPSSDATKSHDDVVGFVDPFNDDRRDYFDVGKDGKLICRRHPAAYIVALLQLNRRLLTLLRVRRMLRQEIAEYIEKTLPAIEKAKAGHSELSREQLAEIAATFIEYNRLMELCDFPLRGSSGTHRSA